MSIPLRLQAQTGRFALVDGIPFKMPVTCENSPVLMAAFPINAERARALLPGNEVFPLQLLGKGLLVITVIDYLATVIGKYIEFSIGIACTHQTEPAPDFLPKVLTGQLEIAQFVYDLPVSSEISVKGGKGIWGMPKHQANLGFDIGDDTVTVQYEAAGRLAMAVQIRKPQSFPVPLAMTVSGYSQFRGMLFKSYLHFEGHAGVFVRNAQSARLVIGDHPLLQPLKDLQIEPEPLLTAFIPAAQGVLDDHSECWFLTYEQPPTNTPQGMESVMGLGFGQQWLAPPQIKVDFDLPVSPK
jgi:hypothetical protein